jgi:hypothetical protein
VAKRILVRDEVDAEFAAAGIQFANFAGSKGAPVAPNGFVFPVSEGVFHVQLELVYFEVGKVLDEFQQCVEPWHTCARDIEHDAAAGKIRVIEDSEPGETASILAQQVSQGRDRGAETGCMAVKNADAGSADFQAVTFGMGGIFCGLENLDGWRGGFVGGLENL